MSGIAVAARRSLLGAVHLLLLALAQPSESAEGKYGNPLPIDRYALIVGVQNYTQLEKVRNAQNDAQVVGHTLSKVGFNHPRVLHDPDTKEQIMEAVNTLVSIAGVPGRAATMVLYFAGHGFQHEGVNYLAPRLARKPVRDPRTGKTDKTGLLEDSIPIPNIIAGLKARRRPGVTILLVDACRTNILRTEAPASMQEPNGFSQIDDAQNAVLSLAAKSGRLAKSQSRYAQANSPYATALKALLPTPLSLNPLLDELASQVQQDTGDQAPESKNREAAGSFFYFQVGGVDVNAEKERWLKAKDRKRKDCVRNFLHHYPDGQFAQHAVTYLESEPPSPADLNPEGPCSIL